MFLSGALSAHAQTAASSPKPTGTISGKVTLSEKGAADIVVTAQPSDRPPFQQALSRATTDAGGHYRLAGLEAGQYQIMAIAPALAVSEQSGYGGSFYGPGKAVVLAANENVDNVDIKLVRGSVITGRVTDADGKPVVEERVNLQAVDQSGNPTRQQPISMWNYQMSQTDDRGIYRIYGLAAGRYRVSVGTNENEFMGSRNNTYYPLTFYGATSDAAKATVVELQEGTEATNIDIRVGRAERTFVASGRLIDSESGQPISGNRISYGPARPNQPFYGGFVGSPTGPRGEFRLEGLEPGRYGIAISGSFESSSYYGDPLFFEVRDADITNLELKATRGLTISGVVVFEGSRARELQQHIGTLRILARRISPAAQNEGAASSAVAADGGFQINGIRPGKIQFFVAAYSNPALRGVTTLRTERGGVDVSQGLDIQAAESIADLRIVAGLGAGTIRGSIRFVGGEPPANMRLFVSVRREGGTPSGGAMVDARGHYSITSLVSATYQVALQVSYQGGTGREVKPQTQTVVVSDEAEAQVDFIVDLTPREGRP
jgi:protocatechuate 3,4-dioxygenase beta subunit